MDMQIDEENKDQKAEQKADDNVESSSTGSDGGKGGGSGSGGGYSADCSSSDASSLEAVKGGVPDKELARLNVHGDRKSTPEPITKESKSNKDGTQKTTKGNHHRRSGGNDHADSSTAIMKSQQMRESEGDTDSQWNSRDDEMRQEPSLLQWNGVRVRHPMDPRIDISTVGIAHSGLHHAGHEDAASAEAPPENDLNPEGRESTESSEPPPPPSIDQYMNLMEVINRRQGRRKEGVRIVFFVHCFSQNLCCIHKRSSGHSFMLMEYHTMEIMLRDQMN